MKKILIIGGAGFIGFHLIKKLSLDKNNYITVVDSLDRGKLDRDFQSIIDKNVNFIKADLSINSEFKKLEVEYDEVYMLASVVGVNNALSKPHEIIRINTFLIINTLQWLSEIKVKKVLFTSTSENYAGTIENFDYLIPTPEEVPLCIGDIEHPRFTYAVTKILGESGFLNYANAYNFKCIIIRYHNVYGPRMGFKHVIPHLAERFYNKESPFLIYGHDQTRAFCYIDDAVDGTILAMNYDDDSNSIYHIGTEEEVTIEHLTKQAGLFFQYKGDYKYAETFPGSTRRRCPKISKAKNILGYQPKYNLNQGLEMTLNWYTNFFKSGEKTFETSFEKPN